MFMFETIRNSFVSRWRRIRTQLTDVGNRYWLVENRWPSRCKNTFNRHFLENQVDEIVDDYVFSTEFHIIEVAPTIVDHSATLPVSRWQNISPRSSADGPAVAKPRYHPASSTSRRAGRFLRFRNSRLSLFIWFFSIVRAENGHFSCLPDSSPDHPNQIRDGVRHGSDSWGCE